jgi:ribose transport system permease protein
MKARNWMAGRQRRRSTPRLFGGFGFERFSGLYLWALFILVFSLWVPGYFLTSATLDSVADSQALPAVVAIAALVPLTAGVFDLSVGATTNLCAIFVVVLQVQDHVNMWLAIVIGIATGALIGAVNGFFVVRMHVDSFVTTLGASVIISAVQGIVSAETQPNPVNSSTWNELTQKTFGGFQVVVLYALVVALVVWWALDHTPAGRFMYATGGNLEAARLSGVQVGKWRWTSLIVSGGLSGIAGVLYGSLNGPSLTFGSAMLLPAFAAVFLGSTQFTPGRANLWGTVLAVYVLATGVQGLQLVTGVQWLNDMFSGVALVGAVTFAVWRQRRSLDKQAAQAEDLALAPDADGPDAVERAAALHGPADPYAREAEPSHSPD